ncbi:ATP-binding cassette domain-containing protein [Desulfovibrio porci]|uniref:ATP-binding cassette domain-containing protein n=1 Tax=Desulfovibrio porci TaxID=2605782 RepID=UPI003A95CD71
MNALYQCRDLTQRYEGRTVLHLPELNIARGEVLALTGPNGAGKSTLLRLLAFLEEPASGELHFHGTPGRAPRQEVTLLLQEPYLLKTSVFENVVYGLRVRGRRHDLREAAEAAMLAVGFAPEREMLRRPWKALSGGEKQRVALAARLILRPLVLLLDEPTSSVDAASAKAIEAAVRQAALAGTTVVAASHDLAWLACLDARRLELDRSS